MDEVDSRRSYRLLWITAGFALILVAWVLFWAWSLSGAIWIFVIWAPGVLVPDQIPFLAGNYLCLDVENAPGSFVDEGCAPLIVPSVFLFLAALGATRRAFKEDANRTAKSIGVFIALAVAAQLVLLLVDGVLLQPILGVASESLKLLV